MHNSQLIIFHMKTTHFGVIVIEFVHFVIFWFYFYLMKESSELHCSRVSLNLFSFSKVLFNKYQGFAHVLGKSSPLVLLKYLYIAFNGGPAAMSAWKKFTDLYSASLPSMVVAWLIRIILTNYYLGLSHFEFCSTNPPSKQRDCFAALKMNTLWTPFFKIAFSKVLSRICTPILNSVGPAVFEKYDFLLKIDHIYNEYINWVIYLDIGDCQRPTDGTNWFCRLLFIVPSFLLLENWSNFSCKNGKKWFLDNVHFLVNYVTFEIYS